MPLSMRTSLCSSADPTGRTIRPPGFSCFRSLCGIRSGAAVTMILSKGAPEPLGPIERIEAADRFIRNTLARIEHGGERAFYRPSTDHIQMPDEGLFCGTDTMNRSESYFAVLGHETIHYADLRIMPSEFEKCLSDAEFR